MSDKYNNKMAKELINQWKKKHGRETLFLHKKANIAFDCFPRSKSTLIASNIFFNNYECEKEKWDNRMLKWNLIVDKTNAESIQKVLCIRCPKARFRSYLLSKIVNPHVTSILPLFYSDHPKFVDFIF